jgi:hypothetical protein
MSRADRSARSPRLALAVESAVILGFALFYFSCFGPRSPLHGPYEVFAQDSVYILDSLEAGKSYRWNAQSHILYHWTTERGWLVWQSLLGGGAGSLFFYLKLFTALCGAGFLAGMRALFRELGAGLGVRVVLLLLTGVSVSAWFHFAAFETHCLAMPALALYLLALARLRRGEPRGACDRLLLVGSLLVCGWTRVDLFRFAAGSVPLLLLPRMRRHARSFAVDLGLVALLGIAGNAWLVHSYSGDPFARALWAAFTRADRPELEEVIRTRRNLEPESLARVGRAVTLYSLAMPVDLPPGRGFLAPPTYTLDLVYSGAGALPSTDLFAQPARNMLGSALSLLALVGVGTALVWAIALALARAVRGDVLHAALLLHALLGWPLYTWFNPHEPFLWAAEFMPLWVAMIADHLRGRDRPAALVVALLAACLLLHNWFAFYLPFR